MTTQIPKLIALCVAGVLVAQTAPGDDTDQNQPRSSQSATSSSQSDQSATAQSSESMPEVIRFTHLKEVDVKSASGDNLGKVEDLIVDRQGRITFAVLKTGGILGIGAKHVPVPWQALDAKSQKEFTMNIEKEKLESAPTLKRDFSDLNNPEFTANVYRHFSMQPTAVGGSDQTPGGTAAGSSSSQKSDSKESKPYEQ